ncbi:hypothetical protein [Nonomuraea sp. SYSU D8015]|uniref:hypothetical protein n=1 Tax=Nonomuraea sp. SYSU D8015 TaxID=2593644 RepID=UPI00166127F7|nr:hypothetical protein [Nonomuraea sp. SYSU D8015]
MNLQEIIAAKRREYGAAEWRRMELEAEQATGTWIDYRRGVECWRCGHTSRPCACPE